MLLLVILFVVFLCCVLIFKRRQLYYTSWQLPGPNALLPIVGNGFSLMCDSKDLLKKALKLTDPYASPLRLWIGPRLVIFIKDAEQLQAFSQVTLNEVKSLISVLNIKKASGFDGLKNAALRNLPDKALGNIVSISQAIIKEGHFPAAWKYAKIAMQSPKYTTKSFVYRFLTPFMGDGLFTSSGVKHKSQRKLLQPLFGQKVLEGNSVLFQKHSEKLVTVMEPFLDKGAFDVLHILHDSAFEATMDILVEDKNDHAIDYKVIPGYVRRFYHIFSQRVITFWMYSDLVFKLTGFYKEQQKMVKIASTFTDDITRQRIPEINVRLLSEQPLDNKDKRTPSVLEMMTELVKYNPAYFTEEEFRDHMMTFVATSQDTQSSAIAFTLMMLGMHKNIQAKVFTELKEVLEERKIVYFNDTCELKYMEMCIKEAMRLFPLGPFLPRDVLEDFKIDNWTIPRGCSLILGIYNVHRDPKYWERPAEFYPEHFENDVASKRHPYAFLPFSGGPRRCIAQQYSYVNMKIIIANILINYAIHCSGSLKDLELMTDVSIRPMNGYMIKISKRI